MAGRAEIRKEEGISMKYQLGEGFWSAKIRQVCDRMIPLQLSILNHFGEKL